MAKRTESTIERVQKYEARVKKLEEYASRDPAGYRTRVFLLYALGIGYALFWLALAIGLLIVVVYLCIKDAVINYAVVKLVLVLLGVIVLILSAFKVDMPPESAGVDLNKENAPALFELLADLQKKLATPPVHHVLLDGQFNASAAQRPRFGFFGGSRNTLRLGLPLLDSLSPEQLRFVVGHELGHHSRNHSRFSRLIYQAQGVWYQLSYNFRDEKTGQSDLIFGKFYRWFVPYFTAYTYALRRQSEFEADRFAVQYTSPQAGCGALVALAVQSRWVEKSVWKRLEREMAERADFPESVYLQIAESLKQPVPQESATEWLRAALRAKTDYADSHPSLTDRLRAMGITADLSNMEALLGERPPQSAAQFYFGVQLPFVRQQVEELFRFNTAERWKEGHEQAKEFKTRQRELEAKAQTETLSVPNLLELGSLYERFDESGKAMSIAESVLEREPNNVHATFALGRMMLEENREEGLALVERAMEGEPDYLFAGCDAIYGYLQRAGRDEEAEAYRSRYYAGADRFKEMEEERQHFRPDDVFLPASVDEEFLVKLREKAEGVAEALEIIIVCKQVRIFPEKPCYYVYFTLKMPAGEVKAAEVNAVIERLHEGIVWPFSHYVFTNQTHKERYSQIQRVAGAIVYKRQK